MAEVTALRNNALPYPVYGAPFTIVIPILDADGDPVSGASALDSEISKNGDTPADCTNEATEIGSSGAYYLSLTGTELTCDVAQGVTKTSTSGAKTTPWALYPRKLVTVRSGTSASGGSATSTIVLDGSASAIDDFYNGMVCIATIDGNVEVRVISDYVGSTQTASVVPDWNVAPDNNDTFIIKLPEGVQIHAVNATHIGGTSQTGRDLGASVLISSGTGTGQLSVTSGVIASNVTQFGGSAATSSSGRPEVNTTHAAGTAWGSGAITAGALAADAITAAKIADGAIDRATFAADTGLAPVRSNTAQGGAAGTITLDASASATTDFYVGCWVLITGATGVGQARVITAYNGTSKVATIAPNWATSPDNTSTFAVLAAAQITGVQGNVTGSVATLTNAPSDSSGVTTLLSRLSSTRAGYLDNLSAGAVALASTFSGITSLAQWLGLIAGKQSGNSTARTEIRATGAGSGTYDEATDSQEALRDNTGTAGAGLSSIGTIATVTTLTNAPSDSSGVTTLLSRLSSARAGYLDNLSAGAAALASTFTGITSLAQWLGLMAGKQTGNSTARTEMRATGAGSGTFDETTDALEAVRDRGDSAWPTVTASAIRSAVGLASANLDTQLDALPTAAETADAVWDEAQSGHSTPGTFGEYLDASVSGVSTGGVSAGDIADAVWDEARADHVSAGTFGQGAASVQGNVTGSVGSVSGAVGSVTGNVGGNVTGSIGSLASQAKADVNAEADTALSDVGLTTTITGRVDAAVGTRAPESGGNLAAVKAKTDNLPASPAATGDAMALTSGERTTLAGVLWDRLTSAITTSGSIGKLLKDTLDAAISSRSSHSASDVWAVGTRTLTGFGTLASDVWAAVTRTLTSAANITSTGGTTVPQTGDAYARLGAPAGASVSADVAAVKADSGTLTSRLTSQRATNLDALPARLRKNVAFANFQFLMVSSSDHLSAATGRTVSASRVLDNGAIQACANSVTEIGSGLYRIDLATADVNGNIVTLIFSAPGADARVITAILQEAA